MINENDETINEKLDFFLETKDMIHIELKSKRFLNCIVLEKIKDNIYLVKERKLGNLHLFSSDVYNISKFIQEKTSDGI